MTTIEELKAKQKAELEQAEADLLLKKSGFSVGDTLSSVRGEGELVITGAGKGGIIGVQTREHAISPAEVKYWKKKAAKKAPAKKKASKKAK